MCSEPRLVYLCQFSGLLERNGLLVKIVSKAIKIFIIFIFIVFKSKFCINMIIQDINNIFNFVIKFILI